MFDQAYMEFLKHHQSHRTGERLRRLLEGHGHAEQLFLEKVWWPAFGQFHHLHPEYEVFDFKEGSRFLDYSYLRGPLRVAIEIDGFGPHLRNISRWQFSDQCRRQNYLTIDGWKVLRFSYDCLVDKPRICQQELQQFMGRWLGEGAMVEEASAVEKEIVRLAMRLVRPITPGDVAEALRVGYPYARKLLNQLVEKGWLVSNSGNKRIRSYRLDLDRKPFRL
jgi:hypothetical protein